LSPNKRGILGSIVHALTSIERAITLILTLVFAGGIIVGGSLIGGTDDKSSVSLFVGFPVIVLGLIGVMFFFAYGWYNWTPKEVLVRIKNNHYE
jgi:fumarate reductase subunit C